MRTVDPDRHRARRRQIIEAAAELFAARGLDGTTTAAISEAAGMSTGNLFHYFSSKREIFFAVLERGEAEKAERLAAAKTSDDPWGALLDVVDYLAAPAIEPLAPPLVMEAMLQAQRDPELAAWLSRDEANEQATIEHLVVRAVAAGQIDPGLDPRDAAAWIMALIGALYLQAATDSTFKPGEQLATLRLILQRFARAER